MTAIFMVWNNGGFALAADESLSITDEDDDGNARTLWTDVAEKIFVVPGHKVAVASAGVGSINSIPIEALLARWAKALPNSVQSLQEYVLDFLGFLQKAGIPDTWHYRYSLKDRTRAIFNTFKKELESNPQNLEKYIEELISEWTDNEPVNVFGNGLAEYMSDYPKPDKDSEKHLWVELISQWLEVTSSGQSSAGMYPVIDGVFDEVFTSVFEVDWDRTIAWHEHLKDKLIPYLFNYADAESVANLLFVGYGEADWIPVAAKVNLRPFANSQPRATLVSVTNPNYVWYLDLAQSGQVDMFLRGMDTVYKEKVLDLFTPEARSENSDKMNAIEKERFSKMNLKVNALSVAKLEFVARSFVEMESLGSFLIEYLPSVGGNIKVTSMTR